MKNNMDQASIVHRHVTHKMSDVAVQASDWPARTVLQQQNRLSRIPWRPFKFASDPGH